MEKRKRKPQKNLAVDPDTWKEFQIEKLKQGFSSSDTFIKAMLKLIKKFKPELQDFKK